MKSSFFLGVSQSNWKSINRKNNMAEFFFSEARAGLILINWKNDMAGSFSFEQPTRDKPSKDLIIPYASKGARNGPQNDPQNDPDLDPFWISQKCKNHCISLCFHLKRGPEGAPFFDPKMSSEMS